VYDEVITDTLKREAYEKRSQAPQEWWDATTPPPPGIKSQLSQTQYQNEEIPSYAFQSPKHPNDRRAIYGIGVPATKLVQRPRPRRETRPKAVQDVPYPMNTYTDGPRDLGNKVSRETAAQDGGVTLSQAVDDRMQLAHASLLSLCFVPLLLSSLRPVDRAHVRGSRRV
jgi:hypothetical protein